MNKNSHKGFTLVELMLAVLIGGIVMAGIAVFFRSQQRSYTAQEEVAEMQQELRAALEIMTREIRNAGHDMTPDKTAQTGFITASPFQVQFSMDLTDDAGTGPPDNNLCVGGGNPSGNPLSCGAGGWDPNENITFGFSPANDAIPAGGDGIADAGAADLGRATGGGALQALSSNIQAIGFAYAYDNNNDGLLELNGAGEVIWAVPGNAGAWIPLDTNNDGIIDENDDNTIPPVTLVSPADDLQLRQIMGVRIWVLARASRSDPEFVNNLTYKVGANVIAPLPAPAIDNFRRRLLSVSCRCRNMGIMP